MKIERLSSNQIRCTLTADDLVQLDMKMSELAYGSDKARHLFREMMIKARNECGFEADNTPLMIEAIPGGADSLILVITKVEEPEELDTRFSKFSPTLEDGRSPIDLSSAGADDIIGLYQKAREAKTALQKFKNTASGRASDITIEGVPENADTLPPIDLIRLYTFEDLDTIIRAAGILGAGYDGDNSLYRSRKTGAYLLTAHKSGLTPEEFNRVCNILTEYGHVSECTPALEAHFNEHEEVVLRHTALKELRELGL